MRFFALMGTAIANREGTSPVPNTPTSKATLKRELAQFAAKLDVEHRLATYGAALQTLESPSVKDAHYYLLSLEPAQHKVTVIGYKFSELEQASKEYLKLERQTQSGDAVLVSVESVDALRRAYPNYFLDTAVFIEAVKEALKVAV